MRMSGLRRTTITSTCAAVLLASGCSFGFSGGGLPPGIKTVAIADCLNNTADPGIAQFVRTGIQRAMEGQLGLRTASESQADALVHCTITRYDPDQPAVFSGTQGAAGVPNQVNVSQRLLDLSADITVIEQKTGRTLWDGHSSTAQGTYATGRETDGRQRALDLLIKRLIDGVHANW
jgi:hypothetical protein